MLFSRRYHRRQQTFPLSLPPQAPLFRKLARLGEPSDFTPEAATNATIFGSIQPECVVPIVNTDARLTGIIALGTRLSEEPYSSEDKRLVASVAKQTAVVLENIRLAEGIAKRIEAERRTALEMEFARQVQARLFPQRTPLLTTLEYTGICIQARQVGGDYYDFLELTPDRVAFVIADVAGKGVSAALMMANLQANLRSQYAMALDNVSALLASVNRLFYANSGDSSYATLFFAIYDDSSRRFSYANCGHLPPLLLRAAQPPDGSSCVEKLESISTVLGLFEQWECHLAEIQLLPGDALVMYTDGVTEAEAPDGEEFGETRLLQAVKNHSCLPTRQLQQAIIDAVRTFSTAEHHDDITLVVARCRST